MNSAVAALQMSSTRDREENLTCAELLIKKAAGSGVKLVVLPENFALYGIDNLYPAGLRESENNSADSLRKWLSSIAIKYRVWLVAGSIPIASCPADRLLDKHVRAACLVINDCGDEVARYDKIHLFDVDVADDKGRYRESATVAAGDQVVLVDTPCGRLGLTICYDLRFAAQFHQLRQQGAEIITVPSAFTATTGAAHWQVLLRARAIETQCYIVAPNQSGRHSATRCSYGHSMIIDPWGEVLACLQAGRQAGCGVVSAEIDLEKLTAVRKGMPIQDHQRLVF